MEPKFSLSAGDSGTMHLTHAVLLYQGGTQTVASLHRIGMAAGEPVVLAGRALRTRSAHTLARALADNDRAHGYLSPDVLCADHGQLIWWLAPGKRQLSFRLQDAELHAFFGGATRSALLPHPGLVFRLLRNGDLQVWAVKGQQRPQPDTSLLRAPYFNVWKSGKICLGNVPVPRGTTADRIGAWHRAFFDSYFTHPNDGKGLLTYKGGAYAFWRDLLDNPPDTFPEQVLVAPSTPLTLATLIAAGGGDA
jgi:PRTRC genetic system protein B